MTAGDVGGGGGDGDGDGDNNNNQTTPPLPPSRVPPLQCLDVASRDGCQDVHVVSVEVEGRDELAGGMGAGGTSTDRWYGWPVLQVTGDNMLHLFLWRGVLGRFPAFSGALVIRFRWGPNISGGLKPPPPFLVGEKNALAPFPP